MAKVCVYTREVNEENYPAGLARSVHIAVAGDSKQPFNKNYGILFASGSVTPENTICPKGVEDPGIFVDPCGDICIYARRVLENGEMDASSEGMSVLWRTKDLIHFSDEVLATEDELKKLIMGDRTTKAADLLLASLGHKDEGALSEGGKGDVQKSSLYRNEAEIDDGIVDSALIYWSPVTCIGVTLPNGITVSSEEELKSIRALISYSDGSSREKNVSWNLDGISFDADGEYEITGHIKQQRFKFPLANGYGDPVIFHWDDKWYYISTNDNLDDIGFYVREADNVHDLFAEGVVEHLILGFDPSRDLEKTFWAPEFHVIGDDLYLLFAISGHEWGPQCHMMRFKRGGRITDPASWEDPVRVLRADGTPLTTDGITLDMTYVKAKSGSYVIWSYRKNIMNPLDTGSMLYIASIDENKPWMLTSEPVLLTRPLLGWENVSGTINNEGPYSFIKDGTVYVTYSGGAANGYTYVLGLLTAKEDDDLTDLSAWKKSITPVLQFYSVDGEFGPGHNAFFVNEDGELMISYHGETDIKSHLRCDGIRRVHFREDGSPYFQMAASEDVPDMDVKLKVKVHK